MAHEFHSDDELPLNDWLKKSKEDCGNSNIQRSVEAK